MTGVRGKRAFSGRGEKKKKDYEESGVRIYRERKRRKEERRTILAIHPRGRVEKGIDCHVR